MAKKYKNRYRSDSIRAQWWDYGNNGAYFVTICTHDRQHFFGRIQDGQMELSPEGQIAHHNWQLIPRQFVGMQLDAFVVMPNHVHGIVVINRQDATSDGDDGDDGDDRAAINRGSTTTIDPTIDDPQPGGITGQHNPMLHQNLSRAIRWYKGRTTHDCRKINPDFRWQSRFYDHIIRDQGAFDRIAQYIHHNPARWAEDKLN